MEERLQVWLFLFDSSVYSLPPRYHSRRKISAISKILVLWEILFLQLPVCSTESRTKFTFESQKIGYLCPAAPSWRWGLTNTSALQSDCPNRIAGAAWHVGHL